jgi:protein-S-isoprenylcysteine O-methyltransferase Ste14/thiol-disulfide isomerase/thioredoxin
MTPNWRSRWRAISAIVLLQIVAVLTYRAIESVRGSGKEAPFAFERAAFAPPFPPLELQRTDGSVVRTESLRGKPLLLHFWASWCPPCRDELPGLLELERDAANPRIVALSLDNDWAAVRQFFGGPIPSAVLRDPSGTLAKRYEIGTLPDTYLLDGDGVPALRFAGAREWRGAGARAVLAPFTGNRTSGAQSWRPSVALCAMLLFCGLNFGVKTWRQWKLTGSTGFHGISGKPGSLEWLGGALFVVGMLLAFAAPLVDFAGLLGRFLPGAPVWVDAFALALVGLGIAGTAWAQIAMGVSWRIGVQKDEHTALVERGPFRWVRNPFFSFMLVTAAGVSLLLPSTLSLVALISLGLAVELQVRFAEEPYLLNMHGHRYEEYCRRVGRFVPGVGKTR